MVVIPDNPDARLRRKPTAEALTAAGYPCSPQTLATQATRGGGPLYQLFGRIPLYRWRDSLVWAEGKLSPPRRSTSEVLGLRADEPAHENFVASKAQLRDGEKKPGRAEEREPGSDSVQLGSEHFGDTTVASGRASDAFPATGGAPPATR